MFGLIWTQMKRVNKAYSDLKGTATLPETNILLKTNNTIGVERGLVGINWVGCQRVWGIALLLLVLLLFEALHPNVTVSEPTTHGSGFTGHWTIWNFLTNRQSHSRTKTFLTKSPPTCGAAPHPTPYGWPHRHWADALLPQWSVQSTKQTSATTHYKC